MESNAKYEGWAIVELFGHAIEAGYVRTLYFGNQVMFEIESPEIPQREVTLLDGAYFNGKWLCRGSKVMKSLIPTKYRMVGSGAVYAINPCSEDTVTGRMGGEGNIELLIQEAEQPEEMPF